MAAFCAAPSAQAGLVTWSGLTSGTWATTSNWIGNATPKSGDIAVFDTTFTSGTLVLGTNPTAFAGIWLTTGLGQDVRIDSASSSVRTMTLTGTSALTGSAAILLDDAGNHNFTTGTSVTLIVNNTTSFLVNNSGTLTASGSLSVTAGKTLTLGGSNAAGNIVISGNIANTSGALNVSTAGVVTLSGSNAFTGGLTLNSGTLKATNSAANLGDSSGLLTLNGGSLWLADTVGQNYNLSTTVSGTTQIISDVATQGAGLTYTFGRLDIGGSGVNTTLMVSGGSNVTNGTAGVTFSGTTTLYGSTTFRINTPGSGATLLTVGSINNFGNDLTLNGSGNFAQTGVWTGAGGVITAATYTGTATLNQNNYNITGTVTLNGGTVMVNNSANALGSSSGTVALNGGTLIFNNTVGVNLTFGRSFTVGANSKIVSDVLATGNGNTYTLGALSIGNQTLTIAGGPNVSGGTAGVTFSGTTTLAGSPTFNIQKPSAGTTLLTLGVITNGTSNITLDGNGNFAQSGVWGNGSGGLITTGSYTGTATLNQNNTFTGGVTMGGGVLNLNGSSASSGITITGGTVVLGNAAGLGSSSVPVAFGGVGSGGKLQINVANITIGSLNGVSTVSIIEAGSAGPKILMVNDTGSDSYAGILQNGAGTLALFKSGSGTLTLTGSNTFSGGLKLSGGILNVTTASIGSGSNVITFNSGTLQAGAGGINTTQNVAMSDNGTIDTNGNDSVISGTVSGGGVLTKIGVGKLTLSGNNTFSSGLVINNGTMVAGSSLAFGWGNITFGTSNAPTVDLNGQVSGTTGLLSGSGSNGVVTNSAATGTATLSLYTSGTQTYAGVIRDGATAQVGLTKADVGTQILNGYVTNSYSGNTTLNGGALRLDFANLSGATNLINPNSNLVLGGGNLSIKGAATGSTSQTFVGGLTLTGSTGSIITVDPNGGAGTTLTLGNNWTRSTGATLLIDYSAASSGGQVVTPGDIVLTSGSATNGIFGWLLVKDSSGIGFGTRAAGSNQPITRYADASLASTLTASSNNAATNFTTLNSTYGTSGTLSWTATNPSVNALIIDTTGTAGTINLGSLATGSLTLTSGAIFFRGSKNETITGGQLGAKGSELIIHQTSTSGTLIISSPISSGNGSLIKDGDGVLVLSGSNNYTGGTNINGGTIQFSSSTNLGNAGTVVLNNNCTLELTSGSFTQAHPILANGSGGVLQLDSGTLSQTARISITSDLTIKGAGNLTFPNAAVPIDGAGGLTFASSYSGTSTLSNSVTFFGGLTINGGMVVAPGLNAVGNSTAANAVALSGGTLVMRASSSGAVGAGTGANVTVGGNTQITADTTTSAGNIYTFGTLWIGSQTLAIAGGPGVTTGTAGITFGATSLTGNATFNITNPTAANTSTLLTVGSIDDNGYTLTLTGTGNFAQSAAWGAGGATGGLIIGAGYSGTATLSQANLYAGPTTVGGGMLLLSASNALPSTTTLTVTSGTVSTGTNNNSVAGLSLQGGVISGSTGVLTVSGTIDAQSGTISAMLSDAAGLTKTTSGTVTLSGSNVGLTGPVTINGGTLVATGAISALGTGTSMLTLNNGALVLSNAPGTNLTFGRNVTAGGATQIVSDVSSNGAGNTYTLGGLAFNSGTMTVLGGSHVNSGTAGLTFSGTTTLSGNTKIVLGKLNAGASTTVLTLGTINDNGYTLTLSGTGNFAQQAPAQGYASWISWGGGLTLDASYSGTAVLNQNNNYLGQTIINGGTLVAAVSGNAIGQNSGTNALILGGGNLVLSNTTSAGLAFYLNTVVTANAKITSDVIITGSGGTSGTTGATYTLADLVIGTQTLTIAGGTSVTSGTAGITFFSANTTTLVGNPTFNIINPINSGSATTLLTLGYVASGTNNITLTGTGGFAQAGYWSGAGGLILAATYSGTATLSMNNTFTGAVTVGGGQLYLLGSSYSSGITINSGTVSLGNNLGLGQTTATVAFGSGTTSKLQLTTGSTGVSGNITISSLSGTSAASIIESGTNTVSGTDTLTVADYPQAVKTYAGILRDGSATHILALTKGGSGTLILTGTNTYTGLLTLSGGVLNATTAAINGTNTTNGIIFNGGALKAGTGGITTAKAIAMTGAGTFDTGAAGTSSLLSGTLSGAGGLTVSGSGMLMLTSSNSFRGGITLTGGTLNGNTASLNSGTTGYINAITFNGGTLQAASGGIIATGGVTLAGNGTFDTNGNNSIISSALVGSGTFTKAGAGMLTLSGGNTFDGGVVIAGGTLQANNNQPGVVGQGDITFTGPNTVLDLNGWNATIGLLSGTVATGTVNNSAVSGSAILTLFGSGTQTFSGIIADGAAAKVALIKTGVGVEILSGSSNYTGATTLNGGTLKLDFSNLSTPTNLISGSSALVLGGGVLSIQGKASSLTSQTFASLTASAGPGSIVIAPGTSGTAALTITSPTLTRSAGATVNFNIAAGSGTASRVYWSATPTYGILGGAYTVTDGTSVGSTGFATVTSGTIVGRYTGATTLTTTNATAATGTTNFTTTPDASYTSGTLKLTIAANHATNTLSIASGTGGTLDIGSYPMTFTSGALLMTGTGNYTITNNKLGADGTELIVHQFASGTLTINSALGANNASLTKDGAGTLVLGGASSSTGTTTINGGTIQIASSSNFSSGWIILNGGTLDVTSGFALGRPITAFGSGGALQVDSGTLTESSPVSTGVSNLTISGSGNTVITSQIQGSGVLTKVGAGTLTLTNASANSSGLAITGGTVVLGAAQTITNHYGLSMSGTSTLDIAGYALTLNNTSANSVTFGPSTLLTNSGTDRTLFSGPATFALNFSGGQLGGHEIWVGNGSANFALNITSGMGGGSLYLGAAAASVNLNGTGVLNLGSTLETRINNALNIAIASTVTGFSGGKILSSEYATPNPVGINNIVTTANHSLIFAPGGTGFTLSGGIIDVRSLSTNAGAGGIVTDGNSLTISGGSLLGNNLSSGTGAIALQSGNLLLANAGMAGLANFTISTTAGNDGRTIQMVSGNTGTFTAATTNNPGKIIIGTLTDGGTWDRGTLNSGSNYTITADNYGGLAIGSPFASYSIANNSGFAGIVTGTNALFGTTTVLVNGTNTLVNTGTLTLGVNSSFFAISGTAPSCIYNVGVAGGGNTIVTSATGSFVFGVNDSYAYSTGTINLNRDKGNSNVTLLSNGASAANDININATQTGTGNLYVAAQNLTLNAGITFGGTGGILTDLVPGDGIIQSVLGNGAGSFNKAGAVSTFLTINGTINGTNTVYLDGEPTPGNTAALNSGIALGSTGAVGGTQTWTVHQAVAGAIAFDNDLTTPANWTNGSVSFTQTGNFGTFEAATNSSAPSSASSNYKFNAITFSPVSVTGQYMLVNNLQNDGGSAGTKEALYTGTLSFTTFTDNYSGRYTFELNGQDLYVDRFSNIVSSTARSLVWMNSAANTVSDIRAIGTLGDPLSTGGFQVSNSATLEFIGGDYINQISSRNMSIVPSDSAAAPNSGVSSVTGAYDRSTNYSPSASISFLGSGLDSGTNAYTTGRGTGGTLRIVGGQMISSSYILNPANTVGLIDTTDGGVSPVKDTTRNTVTILSSAAQSLSIVGSTFTPAVAGFYSNGDVVQFTSTGSLPTGLLPNTNYYIYNLNATTGSFWVTGTAGSNTAVTLGSPGSGIVSVSDMTQYPALVVGGTTTINGNLLISNTTGAVNQATLRVGAVDNSQAATVFNQNSYTSVATNLLSKGSGYTFTSGTQGVSVAFTTGVGISGTVNGIATGSNGQINSLALDLTSAVDTNSNPTAIDLLTTFGTITSGTVTTGTAGAFTPVVSGGGRNNSSPVVYVATQFNSSAVLNVTGDLSVNSGNNLAIQGNASVFVGGNVDIEGVGQNQVMLITGTGVGIAPDSHFTLNGNTGSATPQSVTIIPSVGYFHVGDGRSGNLTGSAAQAMLAGDLTVSSNSDINGTASSLDLAGHKLTIANNSTLTVGGVVNLGTVVASGSISAGGNITFNSGSKLSGCGAIATGTSQLYFNSGVTVAPGDPTTGVGKLDLTAANLQIFDHVTLSLAVTRGGDAGTGGNGGPLGTAGVNFAKLSVGTLDLTAITSITVSLQNVTGGGSVAFNQYANHYWTSIISSTSLTGFDSAKFAIDPSGFFGGNLYGGTFGMVQSLSDPNAIDLQYIASIPEPQTWALLAGGVSLLGLVQRLRRRNG